ncbi:MAG: hypothetical protein WCL04_01040, partial [Verrucomicrobiota bacterium]
RKTIPPDPMQAPARSRPATTCDRRDQTGLKADLNSEAMKPRTSRWLSFHGDLASELTPVD